MYNFNFLKRKNSIFDISKIIKSSKEMSTSEDYVEIFQIHFLVFVNSSMHLGKYVRNTKWTKGQNAQICWEAKIIRSGRNQPMCVLTINWSLNKVIRTFKSNFQKTKLAALVKPSWYCIMNWWNKQRRRYKSYFENKTEFLFKFSHFKRRMLPFLFYQVCLILKSWQRCGRHRQT